MYIYQPVDQRIIDDRVDQFRDQTRRYLNGEITEAEFLPLRLQNGLYIQRLAPMLRISIPYGALSSTQLRQLAEISRNYDKGYGHFTTRQNIQLNWPSLEDIPDILSDLAKVQMHAIQTSGNCIRNFTSDPFAGVAADEVADPRPYCEIMRQWATLHPEFAFLPRKFKIAVTGSDNDRAAILVHDIGLKLTHNREGNTGFQVYVGGGLGRTPMIGALIRDFLPERDILTYLSAILRIYNLFGRRDNKYKARIKILVKAWGAEEFGQRVEAEWQQLKGGPETLTATEIARIKAHFTPPDYVQLDELASNQTLSQHRRESEVFSAWLDHNVAHHKQPGYAAAIISLKPTGVPPGDVSAEQMDSLASLSDLYSYGEMVVTHEQNLVFPNVLKEALFNLWQGLAAIGLEMANIGSLQDIICCPGGDFCSLANAKSIPLAEAIQRHFDPTELKALGDLSLNISGCMNACGHHHVGNIGILGVDKKGEEWYQLQLGGSSIPPASLGKVLGPSFSRGQVLSALETILTLYRSERTEDEPFIDTYRRIGHERFKEAVYAH